MATASLKIDIWTSGRGRTLPRLEQDVAELLVPHLEHIAELCAQGYHSGQVVDDKFSGWWTVDRA